MDASSFTSGSYHVSCASDEQESTFLKRARLLRWAQIALGIINFALAVSAIGCEAVPLHHYRRTSAFEHISLYLWPMNLDIRPTIALLACGSVIALLALFHVIVALLPSVCPSPARLFSDFIDHSTNNTSLNPRSDAQTTPLRPPP